MSRSPHEVQIVLMCDGYMLSQSEQRHLEAISVGIFAGEVPDPAFPDDEFAEPAYYYVIDPALKRQHRAPWDTDLDVRGNRWFDEMAPWKQLRHLHQTGDWLAERAYLLRREGRQTLQNAIRLDHYTPDFSDLPPQPSCTNPDMHAKYAERGIEDQCPHCPVASDPGRVGDSL